MSLNWHYVKIPCCPQEIHGQAQAQQEARENKQVNTEEVSINPPCYFTTTTRVTTNQRTSPWRHRKYCTSLLPEEAPRRHAAFSLDNKVRIKLGFHVHGTQYGVCECECVGGMQFVWSDKYEYPCIFSRSIQFSIHTHSYQSLLWATQFATYVNSQPDIWLYSIYMFPTVWKVM